MQPDDKDASLLPRRIDGNFAIVQIHNKDLRALADMSESGQVTPAAIRRFAGPVRSTYNLATCKNVF